MQGKLLCYIYWLNWLKYFLKPRNVQSSWLKRATLLHFTSDRKIHKISTWTLINKYTKQQKAPKRLRLNFHCKIASLQYEIRTEKFSLKLMQRNIGSHKRPVISTKTDFYKVFRELMFVHFNRREVLNKEKKTWETFISNLCWSSTKEIQCNIIVRDRDIYALLNNSTGSESCRNISCKVVTKEDLIKEARHMNF